MPTPVWLSPLLPTDPPKIGDFWTDARLVETNAGIAYIGHEDGQAPVMLVLMARGSSQDAAARDRFAGLVNELNIDTVIARGGDGQDSGRLGRKFRDEDDDPTEPDDAPLAPWVALAYDGTPAAPAEANRILNAIDVARLGHSAPPKGPGYQHYWSKDTQTGLTRLWPLPWPGRHDRAGILSIFASWLLMMLIMAVAITVAILVFQSMPPASAPPPIPDTSPASGSATATVTASASSSSESSASSSPSPTTSASGQASPTPTTSASQPGSPTPNSKL